MNKLKTKDLEFFQKLFDSYTPADHEKINELNHVIWPWPVPHRIDIDISRYSTMNGIQEQVDNFPIRVGMIFYTKIDNDFKPVLERIAVELEEFTYDA